MPVIPSLIDILIALVISILFFLLVIAIGFTLASLRKPEGHSMPAACFALPQINVDNSRHFDEDAYMEARDYSEFYPDSSEDQDMRERDWL